MLAPSVCPKCSAEVPSGALECPACGVIFAKVAGRPHVAPVTGTVPIEAPPAPPSSPGATSKLCPYCLEEIPQAALRCRACGSRQANWWAGTVRTPWAKLGVFSGLLLVVLSAFVLLRVDIVAGVAIGALGVLTALVSDRLGRVAPGTAEGDLPPRRV